jgi:hypothetical protein
MLLHWGQLRFLVMRIPCPRTEAGVANRERSRNPRPEFPESVLGSAEDSRSGRGAAQYGKIRISLSYPRHADFAVWLGPGNSPGTVPCRRRVLRFSVDTTAGRASTAGG